MKPQPGQHCLYASPETGEWRIYTIKGLTSGKHEVAVEQVSHGNGMILHLRRSINEEPFEEHAIPTYHPDYIGVVDSEDLDTTLSVLKEAQETFVREQSEAANKFSVKIALLAVSSSAQ